MNSQCSRNHKKRRRKESIEFMEKIWPMPGFELSNATPNKKKKKKKK